MKTGSGGIEIILVEDNAQDSVGILNTLKKANIFNRVHVLSEGAQVLEFLFRQEAYSGHAPLSSEVLLLLSLNVAGNSGLEALRKIKSDERSKTFPVILLSSSQEDRGVMEGYKMGANACIVKPVDLRKFIEAVAELRLGWLLVSPEGTAETLL